MAARESLTVGRLLLRVAVPIAIVVAAGLGLQAAARHVVADRIHRAAEARGLAGSWRALRLVFPARLSLEGLALVAATGDTVFQADSLGVALHPWKLLVLRPRPIHAGIAHARVRLAAFPPAGDDTLPPEPARAGGPNGLERTRRRAEEAVGLLLAPSRAMPRVAIRDLRIAWAGGAVGPLEGVRIAWLELLPRRDGVRLAAQGSLELERVVPFSVGLDGANDGRWSGGARSMIPDPDRKAEEPLEIAWDGRVTRDVARGVLRLEDSTLVAIGRIPLQLSGSLSRDGPRLDLGLTATGIDESRVIESLPRAVLGPLVEVSLRGSFDYRLTFHLDLSRPDSVDFAADVIPRGLRIEPHGTRLNLLELEAPFVATIHLPRHVHVTRDLSPANPRFLPLERIDSLLAHAVVTNEDGGFYRHRGFSPEAVRKSIAENLRAGAFRRGAGTITMQLVRNLYLGHERTVSRKAQEVVLAWLLENLTGVSKRRLLEIYLNIIEWGPGVHGASEAAHYYFGHDADRLTVDEALFLSTVIPAPRKWRYRFGEDGTLRPFAREQMHFIGRAMIAKGWLPPERLPPVDSLRVVLDGPARLVLFPPADSVRVGKDEPAGSAGAEAQ